MKIRTLDFICINIIKYFGMPFARYARCNDITLKQCSRKDLTGLAKVNGILHPCGFSRSRNLLIRCLLGKPCMLVVYNETIIGFCFHYFNRLDLEEHTIHEGYIGLLPEYRGRGLGRELGKYALNHFADKTKLHGVSSRVSLNNQASLTAHLKLGYKIREKYYDTDMREERVYLTCDLDQYR